jgi:hypothetical protein
VDSTLQARDVALALHPLAVAQHGAKKHDEHNAAAAAVIANARAVKQESPFQEQSGRFWLYPLTIFGRD